MHPWGLLQYESYHAKTIKYSKCTPKPHSNVNIVELFYFYLSKSLLENKITVWGLLNVVDISRDGWDLYT